MPTRDYVCHVWHETNAGWQERVFALKKVLGRPPDSASCANGEHEMWWYCDSISCAVLMANAARTIPGVGAEAREPIEGK